MFHNALSPPKCIRSSYPVDTQTQMGIYINNFPPWYFTVFSYDPGSEVDKLLTSLLSGNPLKETA
jgi:hypothetical protein